MLRKYDIDMYSADDTSASKINEYVHALLKEKIQLDEENHPLAMRLIDDEITKAQIEGRPGKAYHHEARLTDIRKDKPVKIAAKVMIPIHEHPRFNFVGKLLGPKGSTLKRLQEETMTKMVVLGKGSIRDKAKEEELRKSLDPKYAHLSDDLHIEVSALAPPAEAYARLAYALAELRKYLEPIADDGIRQEQLRELQSIGEAQPSLMAGRGGGTGVPVRGGGPPMLGGPGRGFGMPPPMQHQPAPKPFDKGNAKGGSILDRARQALEETSFGAGGASRSPFVDDYYTTPAATALLAENFNNGSGREYYEGRYPTGGGDDSAWKGYGNLESQKGVFGVGTSYGKRPKYDAYK